MEMAGTTLSVRERGPIFQSLEGLEERLQIIDSTVNKLEGEFQPVLRPTEPEPPMDDGVKTDAPMSDVALRLQNLETNFQRLDARLCDIIGRSQV